MILVRASTLQDIDCLKQFSFFYFIAMEMDASYGYAKGHRKVKKILATVSSRILKIGHVGCEMYLTLKDSPEELWYLCESIREYNFFRRELLGGTYWKFTYNKRTKEIYQWVSDDWNCVLQ